MTIFSIGLLVEHPESVSFIGSLSNLVPVTIGNFIGGGLFLGGSYWFVGNR
jgi:nitrite transporter NirC